MKNFFLSLKYARRELRAGLKGFYIFLFCLILGVAAIAAVQSLSFGLYESLRFNGRFILGADIALRTVYEPATAEQLHHLRKRTGVVNIVMETRAMARNMQAGRAGMVELKAVDPFYPLYGKLEIVDGKGAAMDQPLQDMILPPMKAGVELGLPGALVEKEVLPRLGLNIGDTLRIGAQDFIVRGVIAKEPDRISTQQFAIAPRVLISSFVMDRTGLSAHGNQVYYDHRILVPYAKTPEQMQEVVDSIASAFPEAGWRIRTCFNASPRMAMWIERLTQFLTLTGLAALLVGGVGVSNAVRSFLDGKRAHVATLKCLGAQGTFVTRVYGAMILMLALLGTALGLALGIAGSKIAGHLVTSQLSLIDRTGIYVQPLILAAGFGILTSLCFSIWPLARGASVPPNDLFRDIVASVPRWV